MCETPPENTSSSLRPFALSRPRERAVSRFSCASALLRQDEEDDDSDPNKGE